MPSIEITYTVHCAAVFLMDSGRCLHLQLHVIYEVAFCHNACKDRNFPALAEETPSGGTPVASHINTGGAAPSDTPAALGLVCLCSSSPPRGKDTPSAGALMGAGPSTLIWGWTSPPEGVSSAFLYDHYLL